MTEDEVEVTEFLVRQHLTMSHLSQRRDLTDPEVIARFAERVGSEDRLIKLYLLTLLRYRDDRARQPDGVEGRSARAI